MADYVKDKYQPYGNYNYVKSQNSDFVKKIKCYNINGNLNGLNVNTLPGSTTAEAIGAQTLKNYDGPANSLGNGYERNNGNFAVDCINNNNNVVVQEEEPIPDLDLTCEECFAGNSTLRTAILDFLGNEPFSSSTVTVDSGGQFIIEVLPGGFQINTIERFCNEIENAAEYLGVPLSDEMIRQVVEGIVFGQPGFESSINELIECLLEKGIIVDRDPRE